MKEYQLFIDGEFVNPIRGEWFETHDPYTGSAWARIPKGTKEDVDRAVSAASGAL